MAFWPHTPCLACSDVAQPGTVALLGYLMRRFPETGSMGIYNCRPVAGTNTLSKHACGRAGDSAVKPLPDGSPDHGVGDPLVRFLVDNSSFLGLEEVIYARVIYDDASPRGRLYGGVHPHHDHAHWAHSLVKAQSLTWAALVQELGDPSPEEDETMKQGDTGNDVLFFQKALNNWPGTDPDLQLDGVYGPLMTEAVAKYQRAADLEATGEIGSITATLLAEWAPDKLIPGGAITQDEADARYARKSHTHTGFSKVGHTHDEGETAPSTT